MIKIEHEGQAYSFDRDVDGKGYWYHLDGDRANIIVPVVFGRELELIARARGYKDVSYESAKPAKKPRQPREKGITRKKNTIYLGKIFLNKPEAAAPVQCE